MNSNDAEIEMIRCIGEEHLKNLCALKANGDVDSENYKKVKGLLTHCVEKILRLRDEDEGKRNFVISYSDTAGVLQLTFGS